MAKGTAVVTGASSGIGAWIARLLAERGYDLWIVARRTERLKELQAEIEAKHPVGVSVLALDLAEPGAAEKLFAATEGAGVHVDVLVNNAGFGTQGHFDEIPWDKTSEQLRLNVVALTELTKLFVGPMKKRHAGHVLNVASVNAYLAIPGYATYAAGKAYVRNFSEAVAHELRGTGVRVCCVCPGPTDTEFLGVAGHRLSAFERMFLMSAERCARISVRAMFAGRRLVVAGWLFTFLMWMTRFYPRRLVTMIASVFMER
jgi:short-subunit dehydrogenase